MPYLVEMRCGKNFKKPKIKFQISSFKVSGKNKTPQGSTHLTDREPEYTPLLRLLVPDQNQ